jgi:hypothetical protein
VVCKEIREGEREREREKEKKRERNTWQIKKCF